MNVFLFKLTIFFISRGSPSAGLYRPPFLLPSTNSLEKERAGKQGTIKLPFYQRRTKKDPFPHCIPFSFVLAAAAESHVYTCVR